MSAHAQPTFLLASQDTGLLTAIEPTLLAAGARVDIVLSAHAALASISGPHPPNLVLLDAQLPGMPMGQLLAAVRAEAESAHLPIVLIADTVTAEGIDRLAEGAVDDLVLRSAEPTYWQLRLDLVLRNSGSALKTSLTSILRQICIDLASAANAARSPQFCARDSIAVPFCRNRASAQGQCVPRRAMHLGACFGACSIWNLTHSFAAQCNQRLSFIYM